MLASRADVAVVLPERAQADDKPAVPAPAGGAVIVEVELPDMIRETYLEVRAAAEGQVVTLLEILSPTNKRPGEGRGQYLRKRRSVLGLLTHLIEIDLLRAGEPMPVQRWSGRSDYRIMVSRGEQRPRALLIPFGVRQPILAFPLPLASGDAEPTVALGPLLHAFYDRGATTCACATPPRPTRPWPPRMPPGPTRCCAGRGCAERGRRSNTRRGHLCRRKPPKAAAIRAFHDLMKAVKA